MLCRLDHFAVIAPSLDQGVKHVKESLDIDMPFGRRHDGMGTHNHLLSLGDRAFLEVIAADPTSCMRPQWFGLDDPSSVRKAWDDGRRLRGWIVRSSEIDRCLETRTSVLGVKHRITMGKSSFFFSVPLDGSLPMDGAAPSIIDRLGNVPKLPVEAYLGCHLKSFALEYPCIGRIKRLIAELQVVDGPDVHPGETFRMLLKITTPSGERSLS